MKNVFKLIFIVLTIALIIDETYITGEEIYIYYNPNKIFVSEEHDCPQDDNPCTVDAWDGYECMKVWNITCDNERMKMRNMIDF